MRRYLVWFSAATIAISPLASSGCGGDVPPTGSRAVQPADYKEKEKVIADGFKAMMKEQAAAKKKRN